MEVDDIHEVRRVVDAAFCKMREQLYGRPFQPPAFPDLLYAYRMAADPAGCLVALADGRVSGALFSVARGPVAWFGPLATDPQLQARGVGHALIAACLDGWRSRGVRLMGLETFPGSEVHVHIYGRFGFRPSWNGVAFAKNHAATEWPDGVDSGGTIPDCDFVYPGFEPRGDVEATRATGVGETLVTDGGLAVCHVRDTFLGTPGTTFIPLLVARDRTAFARLLQGAESVSARAGNHSVFIRTPGSCWATHDALGEAGYRPGRVFLRMKRGENLDYDSRDLFYCDSWL
jgi:GNAT superfamily N-acetyltransferase